MKIRKVTINNLNSLRLEQTICFDEPPLSHAGLFAITGDTGAGKTTILDALTLALYGKVARNAAEGEVMSYGTGKCLAEIEFEVKEQVYRSKWSIWRAHEKPEGSIQPSRRELSCWDPEKQEFEIIGEKKREIDELIVEITGLDYDRFCRSVMLSQGEFAAFLKAGVSERSELLERITGTEVYSRLSAAAFERHKLEKQRLEEAERELSMLELLSPEEEAALQQQLKERRAAAQEKQAEVKKLREQYAWLEQLEQLGKRAAELQKGLEEAEKEEEAFEPEREKLRRHKQALPLQLPLQRFEDTRQQQQQVQESLSGIEAQLPQLQAEKATAEEKQAQAGQGLKASKKELADKEPLFEQASKLDIEIGKEEEPLGKQRERVQEAAEQLDSLKKAREAQRAQISRIQASLQEKQQWLEQQQHRRRLVEDLPLIQGQREQLRSLFQDRRKGEEELQELQTQLKEAGERIGKKEKTAQQLRQEIAGLEKKIGKLSPEHFVRERGRLLDLMYQEIEKLQTQQQQLQELHRLSEEYDGLLRSLSQYEEKQEHLQSREQGINKELLASLDTIDALAGQLEYKQQAYEQQLLIANYEKGRARLQEGEPCPLCLSTHHPFREKKLRPFVDEARQELETTRKRHEEALKVHRALLNEQKEVELQMEQLVGNEVKQLSGQLNQYLEQMLEYEGKIANIVPKLQERGFAQARTSLLAQKLSESKKLLEERQQARSQLGALIQQLDEKEKALQAEEKELQKLQANRQVLDERQANLGNNLSGFKNKFETARKRIDELLKPYGLAFEEKNAKGHFLRLEKEKQEWETCSQEVATLSSQLEVARSKEEERGSQLEEKEQALQEMKEELAEKEKALDRLKEQRYALFEDKDPKAARQALQAGIVEKEEALQAASDEVAATSQELAKARQSQEEKQKSLQSLKKKLDKLEHQLLDEAQKAGFEGAPEAQQALLSEEAAAELEKQEETLRMRLLETKRSLKDVHSQLEEEREKALTGQEKAALQELLQAGEEELAELQQLVGALAEKQEQQAKRKKRAKGLAEQLEQQKKEYGRWARLNEIIGQKDGKKFRTFAQGLTLQKLTQLANRHLQQLHGRYLIRKRGEEDLELDIIDTYQADNRRSMNTLSGGESFLVSLALALGLSELAGQNTQIQSLFIDEGFGSLDENTLDLAIATLDNLQASGKTIGIISHVKLLKERIATQIQVRKKGNGFSSLEVIG